MYCERCGTIVPDDANFCPNCRAPIAQPQMSAAQQTYTQPQTEDTAAVKKKNTLPIILASVIGGVVIFVGVILAFSMLVGKNAEEDASMLTEPETITEEEVSDLDQEELEALKKQLEELEAENKNNQIDYDRLAEAIAQAQADANTSSSTDTQEKPETTINNYYYYGSNGNAAQNDDYYSLAGYDTYLWPTDTQYISYADLNGLSKDTVAAIRNEIYARHGYAFQTKRWRDYFAAKSWYYRDETCTENTVDARLNSIERSNRDTIVAYEESRGWR